MIREALPGLLATVVDFGGTLLITVSAGNVLWRFCRQSGSPLVIDQLRLRLAADLVTALSLKSGAGIIRTLTVDNWDKFLTVLAVIALRFFLGQTLKRLGRPVRPQP